MQDKTQPAQKTQWRDKGFKIIFEADTPAGKIFDICLLALIFISIGIVVLQSIPEFEKKYGPVLYVAEWCITLIFTLEYICRLLVVKKPLHYAFSFFGLVDILAIIPTYLSLVFPQSRALIVIRALRLLRVFRVFNLSQYVREGRSIVFAMKASARRILVFLIFVMVLSIILGTLVYVVESSYNERFNSIPQSIYWSIVTITTVGYGDVFPITPLGKFLASLIMLLGYAIIAVPTGIVTVEMSKAATKDTHASRTCPGCSAEGHEPDAVYCRLCGHKL
jgi:voltage-gated potassium channel